MKGKGKYASRFASHEPQSSLISIFVGLVIMLTIHVYSEYLYKYQRSSAHITIFTDKGTY